MAVTRLNSFSEVQQFITGILASNNEASGVSRSPHNAFWETMSYDDFVNGNVPGIGKVMKVLVKGDSKLSNLILALQGAPNTPFDPNTGEFGQMPANGPPMFTDDQIKAIADWIDAGCPR